jgi:hypothetical protein
MTAFPPPYLYVVHHLYLVHPGDGNGICGTKGMMLEAHSSSDAQLNLADIPSPTSCYKSASAPMRIWTVTAELIEDCMRWDFTGAVKNEDWN